MSRVDLPDGHWVELRDPMEVRVREKRRALDTAHKWREEHDEPVSFVDVVVRLLVTGWSQERPLENEDGYPVLDLPDYIYSALIDSDPIMAAGRLLFADNFDPSPDPESPTEPSGD